MTMPLTRTMHLCPLPQSAIALAGGLGTIAVLSVGTDVALRLVDLGSVSGPWTRGQSADLVLLACRLVQAVLGSYAAARLAPRMPMCHALALGLVGLALNLAGAIAGLAPGWFAVALVVGALPCAWLGGSLHHPAAGDGVPRNGQRPSTTCRP